MQLHRYLHYLWIPAAFSTALSWADETTSPIHSQACFLAQSDVVELAVTETGGHLGPVTFYRNSGHPVRPYYISPWQDENAGEMPVPVLVPLRGDFFCMPFGGNQEAVDGETHPPHGEVAGSKWHRVGLTKSGVVTTLTLALTTNVRKGTVTKAISLIEGHNVIYMRHTIEGFTGSTPLGHHATLAMPEKEGSVRIATSPLRFGMTYPGIFSNPKSREYQTLLPGAKWDRLQDVPMAWKNTPNADLSRLPGPQGFADLVQLVNELPVSPNQPAWTTATFPDDKYLWFSLKDPRVLRTTVLWMENRGRHGFPWNGRNNCLGLEDVTAYFADGLLTSTQNNILYQAGIPTSTTLTANAPTAVNYIQGVVQLPDKFEQVESVEFTPGSVSFVSTTGQRVSVAVRHEFLFSGQL
ncbi:MAG: hypothetical protein O2931_14915 [Planctomycetota bacterium]|nr:hypothetical protein [Planctomycetota bacterium]MDA1180074.1 hypothetical protein [Planctomycetota bacterium]